MAVIETTTFRLAPGTSDAAFLEADERVRTGFLYRQPGLARATTARGDAGDWIVIVLWESDAAADAAATLASDDSAASEMLRLVDPSSVERRRYRTFD